MFNSMLLLAAGIMPGTLIAYLIAMVYVGFKGKSKSVIAIGFLMSWMFAFVYSLFLAQGKTIESAMDQSFYGGFLGVATAGVFISILRKKIIERSNGVD